MAQCLKINEASERSACSPIQCGVHLGQRALWRLAWHSYIGEEPSEFDLSAFAGTVIRLAKDAPEAVRFQGNRAYISAVWRESQREPGFPRVTLPEFKARLVEANANGFLRLIRADLVELMDRDLLAEMIRMFCEQSPVLLAELSDAVRRGDGPALETSAHKLKGSAANFSRATSSVT